MKVGKRAIASVWAALAVASISFPSSADQRQRPGTFERHSYTNAAGTLDYMLYVPPGPRHAGRSLVVFIPGALGTAEQTAHDTRFNELAAARGFFVLYPEAPLEEGGYFHYEQDENRHRGSGVASIIAGMTKKTTADWAINRRRVLVGGISNGGAVANIMAATYPDIYAVVFSHSGGTYPCDGGAIIGCGTSADESGPAIRREMGPRTRVMPFIVFHGADDVLVPPEESDILVESWLIADDFADDGANNGSIPRTPAVVRRGMVPGGHPYTISYYVDRRGCPLGEYWLVYGMRHAYSGGAPNTPQGVAVDASSERKVSPAGTDPAGPDATAAAYRFLSAHPLGSGRRGCS